MIIIIGHYFFKFAISAIPSFNKELQRCVKRSQREYKIEEGEIYCKSDLEEIKVMGQVEP